MLDYYCVSQTVYPKMSSESLNCHVSFPVGTLTVSSRVTTHKILHISSKMAKDDVNECFHPLSLCEYWELVYDCVVLNVCSVRTQQITLVESEFCNF